MKQTRLGASLALALAAAGLLAACGASSTAGTGPYGGPASSAASPTATATPSGVSLVSTATVTLGGSSKVILTNAQGFTLYYLTSDSSTQATCTGACATNWPPLLAAADASLSAPGLPGKLSVLAGANGRQVLYNGHPLYRFARDTAPGQTNGQGIAGKWYAATPDLASASSAGTYG